MSESAQRQVRVFRFTQPHAAVAANNTIPMMANQSKPLTTNPRMTNTSHTTSNNPISPSIPRS